MMKQSHPRKRHRHPIAIASLDNILIAQRAAGLGNVFHAVKGTAVDGISERNKGIGAERNVL